MIGVCSVGMIGPLTTGLGDRPIIWTDNFYQEGVLILSQCPRKKSLNG